MAVDIGAGAVATYANIGCHGTKSDTTFYSAAATTGFERQRDDREGSPSRARRYIRRKRKSHSTGMTPACYNGVAERHSVVGWVGLVSLDLHWRANRRRHDRPDARNLLSARQYK